MALSGCLGIPTGGPGHSAAVNRLRTSPPPDAEELDTWELETPAQLRELRAGLVKALNTHSDVPSDKLADIPDRMVLVATELATNAIKHGRPPTTVRLLRTPDEFVLDVADHDPTSFPELAETRPIDAGGRGLHLAQAFAVEVGWYASDHAKHIWAAFPADATKADATKADPTKADPTKADPTKEEQ